ncbi:MAG: exodeoxyribonuclease VII large subunit [Gammaproteobacteria bacterium]|nr:exodeoxyribonuclease VII large subunit [Gammaproteobacteria bacterium]
MDEEFDPLEASTPGRDVYSVSRLNREARELLETGLPLLWVEGELSNLARPSSGHLYFSLKDPSAQVRCAMFRNRNQLVRFRPADGMQVLARARVSLYEARGDYQLIVESLEEAGDGALRRAFEQLKQRLLAEGLFDAARKKSVPELPRRIGVITSPTGAAIHDVLTVLRRRFPAIPVLVYPVPVQGKAAAPEIARMIRLTSARAECDVLILCRGGGSLEDLWAFNEEIVARAIADCEIPIVTGIGHEVDVTIADFAADLRAPTPSGAAEHVSPDGADWLRRLDRLDERLTGLARGDLARRGERLHWLVRRLQQQHPGQRLRQQAQRLDELEQRLLRGIRAGLQRRRLQMEHGLARFMRHVPLHRIERAQERSAQLAQRLRQHMQRRLERNRDRIDGLGRALDAVSPLATLGRGYAIVRRLPDGGVVREATAVKVGDTVEARLARGHLVCDVKETRDE